MLRWMKRNTLNYLVDAATALAVIGLVATGLIIRLVLPPGSGERRTLWGLGRHDWGDVHYWIVIAGGVLLMVHLALHWQWICTVTLGLLGRRAGGAGERPPRALRNLTGVLMVVLTVGVFWGFVEISRRAVDETIGGRGAGRGGAIEADDESSHGASGIRGSLTLAEAAATGGMPAELLRSRLGLPEQVSTDERIGRLVRAHGITIARVREIVGEYRPARAATRPD